MRREARLFTSTLKSACSNVRVVSQGMCGVWGQTHVLAWGAQSTAHTPSSLLLLRVICPSASSASFTVCFCVALPISFLYSFFFFFSFFLYSTSFFQIDVCSTVSLYSLLSNTIWRHERERETQILLTFSQFKHYFVGLQKETRYNKHVHFVSRIRIYLQKSMTLMRWTIQWIFFLLYVM